MQRLRSPTARALVVVTLWALIWAKALGLTRFLNPFEVEWLFQGDWQAQLFGWLFTQNGPWAVPLGQAPDLLAPSGTSAAFTDAIPVMAVVGKLFGLFVSRPFQYFGLWMVGGFVGAGVTGVLFARAFVKDTLTLALIGCLFVVNPIMSTRYGHPTFLAFWVLMALVATCLWPVSDLRGARRTAGLALGILAFTCGTHAYLAVMAAGLAFASMLRLALFERWFAKTEGALWIVAAPVTTLVFLWLFGFTAGASAQALASDGFGEFSADLLTFFNATTWSRFFGGLPMGGRQYEGYAYLGLGVFVLLAARVLTLWKVRLTRAGLLHAAPLILVALGFAVFSLSNFVTVGGARVADLSSLYAKLGSLPAIFRSSGRFIWPLHVALLFAAVAFVLRLETAWIRNSLLGVAVLLQVGDFDPTRTPLHTHSVRFEPLRDPAWAGLAEYRHLVVDPIQVQWVCPYNPELIPRLSWEAWRYRLSINSGHVGRPPASIDCRRHLAPSELNDQTVYIAYFPEYLADFTSQGFVCGPLEGTTVCVSPHRATGLLVELQRRTGAR